MVYSKNSPDIETFLNKWWAGFLLSLIFINGVSFYANNYRIKVGRIIRITKKDKEIIYVKDGFKFISIPVKLFGKELLLVSKGNQTYIRNNTTIFFRFPFIKGKCKGLKGVLKPVKITFLKCRLIVKLKNGVKVYAYPEKARFIAPYNSLILYRPRITTCSLEKPHYSVRAGKVYVISQRKRKKYDIKMVYVKDMKNVLSIPFTGFKKSFFIIHKGQQKKVTFRGLNFSGRNRFKKTLTMYFTNIFHFSQNSYLDFNLYPAYSTKRGFFVEYTHLLNTSILKEKTEFFYLNDRIKNPSDSFDAFFFPPPTRNRFYYHTYGDVEIKNLQMKYEIYKLSDKNLLQELFSYKFKNEKQPETYLNIQKFFEDNIYLRIFIRPNLNNFIIQSEYIPLLKIGLLSVNLTNKLSMTLLSTISYLERNDPLIAGKDTGIRLSAKNIFTYKLYQGYFNLNLYAGWMGNIYSNDILPDRLQPVFGTGLSKPFYHTSTHYSYTGLFEVKYLHSEDFKNRANTGEFFDKEDILSRTGELYLSSRNNIVLKHFEIEYNIYQEFHTKRIDTINQSSFYPFEFPTNPVPAGSHSTSHIQDLKLKIKEFTLAGRYETTPAVLFTEKPHLFSLYGEYRYKNRFLTRTTYNISRNMVNSIGVYTGLQLGANYYTAFYINYYLHEHRIVNNILTLTREFHDFYLNVSFSKDVIRNEVQFFISLEPKWGEKNILEENAKKYYFRR